MKCLIPLAGLLLVSATAPAQNMVHNPGFELHTSCPVSEDQVSFCTEWSDPTGASSDYDNACCMNSTAGVPINTYGSQTALEGVAYAGLSPFYSSTSSTKEYIRGNTDPLLVNGVYEVTIHVNKSDISPSATDGLGVLFYKNGFTAPAVPFSNIPETPQIDYTSYGIITDTVNWVTLIDTFTADSAYTHLIIGCFKGTSIVHSTGSDYSYYYIDSINVRRIIYFLDDVPSQSNVKCNGNTDGVATVTATGGTPPYTYLWSPGAQTTASISGLGVGSYTCMIIDAAQDTIYDTIAITQPPVLAATPTQTNASCNGGSDGTATVTASGGTAPYRYSWAPSGGTAATATGLSAGIYTCTITDTNNCTLQQVFTIGEGALTVAKDQNNITCNGDADGSVTLTASGGAAPYTYTWAPITNTSNSITNLTPGTYTCTIRDNNNCVQDELVTITEPLVLSATTTQTDVSCQTKSDGSIRVIAAGGTPIYSYSWTPITNTTNSANDLSAGTYTCTITDAHNCKDSAITTLTVLSNPITANFIYTPEPPLPGKPINFYNQSTPGAHYLFWSFGDGTISSDVNPVKTYSDSGLFHVCLVANDTNDCPDTLCKDIVADIDKYIGVATAFSPNGDGYNDILYIRGSGLKEVKLRIFYRSGNIVFESDDLAIGWDGTYKGQPQPEEVYAYTLEATFTDGTTKKISGNITLLR